MQTLTYYERNRERVINLANIYYSKNRDKRLRQMKELRMKNIDRYLEDSRNRSKIYYQENLEKMREKHRQYNSSNKEKVKEYKDGWKRRIKMDVFSYYSNGLPTCACCGELILEFLCIDHINGGGGKHRKEINRSGVNFYGWLKKNNYPEGYRVLCHNCNMSFGAFGYCPHSKELSHRQRIRRITEA